MCVCVSVCVCVCVCKCVCKCVYMWSKGCIGYYALPGLLGPGLPSPGLPGPRVRHYRCLVVCLFSHALKMAKHSIIEFLELHQSMSKRARTCSLHAYHWLVWSKIQENLLQCNSTVQHSQLSIQCTLFMCAVCTWNSRNCCVYSDTNAFIINCQWIKCF